MLTSRISQHNPLSDPEDIFAQSLSTIFPDDTTNSHGDPGSSVIYRSPRFGDVKLRIPVHPDEEGGRKLFAHALWNAGVVVAEAVEVASHDREGARDADSGAETTEGTQNEADDGKANWDKRWWDVRNQKVLELGAGTALPSIISALSGASSTTITDHPSSPALTTNTVQHNTTINVSPTKASTQIDIYGYTWGSPSFYSTTSYGKPINPPTTGFDKIIIADCLWMPSQHIKLIKTILNFLPQTPYDQNASDGRSTKQQPCALVVAGFHTGRPIVANFFSLAIEPFDKVSARPVDPPWKPHAEDDITADINEAHIDTEEEISEEETQYIGKLKLAEIFEVDVDLNTRPWMPVRDGEGKWEAKRWCAVGVLVRR